MKIKKQEVYNAIIDLVETGSIPTHSILKKKIGTIGDATIQKYFKQWKEECFKKIVRSLQQDPMQASQLKNNETHKLLEENQNLEQAVNKHIAKIEHYAQELINAEKANIALKAEIQQLQTIIQKLQLELTEVKAVKHCLEQVTQKIQNELDLNTNEKIQKMQQTIDSLRLELKTLNETSIIALRETSNQGHEVLMQEKVTNINLQAKIDSLNKELLENKKQSHEAIMTAQVQNKSLLRQNKQLQKIIQEHCLDKLPQLDEELSLKFFKEAASYGK